MHSVGLGRLAAASERIRLVQQTYKTFLDEFAILLSCFDKINSEIIITGYLNVDLLKLNQRPIFSELYDILTASSYLPKITLPTRFIET